MCQNKEAWLGASGQSYEHQRTEIHIVLCISSTNTTFVLLTKALPLPYIQFTSEALIKNETCTTFHPITSQPSNLGFQLNLKVSKRCTDSSELNWIPLKPCKLPSQIHTEYVHHHVIIRAAAFRKASNILSDRQAGFRGQTKLIRLPELNRVKY